MVEELGDMIARGPRQQEEYISQWGALLSTKTKYKLGMSYCKKKQYSEIYF